MLEAKAATKGAVAAGGSATAFEPSRSALRPVNFSQRWTITSQ